MSVWTEITKWITKTFWPWFIKHVWPLIKADVGDLVSVLFANLKEKFKESTSANFQKNEEKTEQHLQNAEYKARNAKTNSEREKWEAVAKVWREVAEMLRKENEDLKMQIDELVNSSEKEIKEKIRDLDLSIDVSKVPSLPAPPKKTNNNE